MTKPCKKNLRKDEGLQPIGRILSQFLSQNQHILDQRMNGLLQNWAQIMGAFLAERIHPLRIEKEFLICSVTSSSLIQEMSFLETEIINKLRKYPFGRDIKGLRFTTTEQKSLASAKKMVSAHNQNPLQNLEQRPLTRIEIEHLQALASKMKEPAQQKRLFRLLKAFEQRKQTLIFHHWKHCVICHSFFEPEIQLCPYCNQLLSKS